MKHQEKFSKDSPYNKISYLHPAQGVQRDWQSPFAVLYNFSKSHNLSEKILQIFHTCIFRVTWCTGICMCRFCQELKIFFFDCFQFCRDSNINGKFSYCINCCFSVICFTVILSTEVDSRHSFMDLASRYFVFSPFFISSG